MYCHTNLRFILLITFALLDVAPAGPDKQRHTYDSQQAKE